MSRSGSDSERLVALEREVRRLSVEAARGPAREAMLSGKLQLRPARVTNTPTAGDNVFSIIFLDGTYTETAGTRTLTWTDRQTASAAVCANVRSGQTPASGTKLMVWRWSGRWWTDWAEGSETETALVRVDASGGVGDCELTGPDSNGVYAGKIVLVNLGASLANAGSWTDGDDVWIVPVNHCPPATQLKKGERYVARKVGLYTSVGVTRELYQVEYSSSTSSLSSTSIFHSPRWWKTYGAGSGTEDTTTGGYVYYPSPHNREFRLSFNSNPINGAGLTHNPASYGDGTGNITINSGGVYVFTVTLQMDAFATSAGWSSPPSPAELYALQCTLGGSGGSEIIGYESFATDEAEDQSGISNATIGTMFALNKTTLTASISRTFASTGVIDIRVKRTNDYNGVSTYWAQEFGVFVYNARLRVDKLS